MSQITEGHLKNTNILISPLRLQQSSPFLFQTCCMTSDIKMNAKNSLEELKLHLCLIFNHNILTSIPIIPILYL